MKRTIEFLDADRNKVVAECEITERNGFPEFTMSGDYAGGCGQVFDHVSPDGDNQKKLIDLWKEWHLNNKNRPLPEDFEDELNDLLDEIESEEEEKTERYVEETDIALFENFMDSECALALALMLNLSVNEIDDIIEEKNDRWCVQGVGYLACSDDQMDEYWDEELDNYLEECVYPDLPENMKRYFDDDAWKRDAKMDGRAHSLNRYDSSELSQCINSTWYYAYRQ